MGSGDARQVFEQAFKNNLWGDADSRSGPGSSLAQTRTVRERLPALLARYGIGEMLDAPCGDFFWMREIISEINAIPCVYNGADIVEDLVKDNNAKYGNERVRFLHLNLIEERVPRVDLVLTRDCFLHLSCANVLKILQNYRAAGVKYVLVSTYSKPDRVNADVDGFSVPGRVLNMQNYPFLFPPPLDVIVEGCTESDGGHADKSLALWRREDLPLDRIAVSVRTMFAHDFYWRVRRKLGRMLRGR